MFNISSAMSTVFLVQGQHPLNPITIHTDSEVPAARLLASQLQHTVLNVQHNLRRAQDRYRYRSGRLAQADKKRLDMKYSVGDQVLLNTRNRTFKTEGTRKFLPKFIGPFTITRLIGRLAVKITLPNNTCRIHPVFHVYI